MQPFLSVFVVSVSGITGSVTMRMYIIEVIH